VNRETLDQLKVRETPPAARPEKSFARASPKKDDDPLQAISEKVPACTRCLLHEGRTNTVPGQGHPHPDVLFVGEGPGADEDRTGIAFIGRAGQLLTKIIEAMGYTRDDVFIANIVKCRPPNNRVPLPDEMQTCLPYLREQIALLKPKVIVTLGATAAKGLLGTKTGITKLRGTWLSFDGIDVMPTYHPAYLLRNPSSKRDVWEDMKAVLERLGREPPARKQN
jgi:DNA polymerase